MGLCVSKPLESTSYKSKLEKTNSFVVQDKQSQKITRVNGESLKSLGNALFFPVCMNSENYFSTITFTVTRVLTVCLLRIG